MNFFDSTQNLAQRESQQEAARLAELGAKQALERQAASQLVAVTPVLSQVLQEFRDKATSTLPDSRWDVAIPNDFVPDVMRFLTGSFRPLVIAPMREGFFSETYGQYCKREERERARYQPYWSEKVAPVMDSARSILVFRGGAAVGGKQGRGWSYTLYLSHRGFYWAIYGYNFQETDCSPDGTTRELHILTSLDAPAAWVRDSWVVSTWQPPRPEPVIIATEFARLLSASVGW